MDENYDGIKKAVAEAMSESMKDFYIDREKHYQHHEFLSGLIEWSQNWKSTCMKAIANAIIGGIIFLLLLGYIAWGEKAFRG